jgi:hypothetical protein
MHKRLTAHENARYTSGANNTDECKDMLIIASHFQGLRIIIEQGINLSLFILFLRFTHPRV